MKREPVTVRLPDGTTVEGYRGNAADPRIVDRLVRAGRRLRKLRLAHKVARFVADVQNDPGIRAARADVLTAIKRAWPADAVRPQRVDPDEARSYFHILRGRGLTATQAVKQTARAFKVTGVYVRRLVARRN